MAAVAHLGVGLAAKRVAPRVPLWVLMVSAWVIDIVWGVLFLAGIERYPGPEVVATSPYSHGLFMAVVWSVLAGLVARRISHNSRTGLVIGLLVFSHWIVDFISYPMTAVFPNAAGIPLLFDGSPTVGLGLYSTQIGVNVGEYGALILGAVIYILTLRKLRNERKAPAQEGIAAGAAG